MLGLAKTTLILLGHTYQSRTSCLFVAAMTTTPELFSNLKYYNNLKEYYNDTNNNIIIKDVI